jgi:hypothetical protein
LLWIQQYDHRCQEVLSIEAAGRARKNSRILAKEKEKKDDFNDGNQ